MRKILTEQNRSFEKHKVPPLRFAPVGMTNLWLEFVGMTDLWREFAAQDISPSGTNGPFD